MKTLTIHPVWAWAIIAGHKRVENRTWATSHRGPLAIHAGTSWFSDAEAREKLAAIGVEVPDEVPGGQIIGTVDLVACVKHDPEDRQQTLGDVKPAAGLAVDPLATGPVCWILENPKPITRPVTIRGHLGLWDADLPEESEACEK